MVCIFIFFLWCYLCPFNIISSLEKGTWMNWDHVWMSEIMRTWNNDWERLKRIESYYSYQRDATSFSGGLIIGTPKLSVFSMK